MSASTKLSTSVKMLSYLAESHPVPKSSKEISEAIGINASKLRQLLSMLSKQDIVSSKEGKTGGFVLTKNPDEIHLQEIYCAIEDRKAFHLDVNRTNAVLNSGERFNDYFSCLFSEIQVEIEKKMRMITLRSIMEKVGKEVNF